MNLPAITVSGLTKTYGPVTALDGITLEVARGSVLAVLGHNGAGKTTLVGILSTRIHPDSGTARVCGYDVVHDGAAVRRRIGVTGQSASVDEALSGRANLVLIARLLGASAAQARRRAAELLAAFDLGQLAERPARTYSGGLRRRLDLAMSLVGAPDVVFLDEPTTGLDPVSRAALWSALEDLAGRGTTIVLTTQYLEEADRLADQVVVLGLGQVTVSGTPARLKAQLGERMATLTFGTDLVLRRGVSALNRLGVHAEVDGLALKLPLAGRADLPVIVRALDTAGAPLRDLIVTEPTLDDVYLSLHRKAAS
ncbi:ATP-binding cassette domain-containing protein [Amycolatopsis sp. NBC_00345]|uniref:ATP-binding cassette domain-containing protein n=1 Tax=Amycolatopsis sp. NBC_00345 TaxID=2975955 RepID=UPI002E25A680